MSLVRSLGRARCGHLLLDVASNHIVGLCGNDPFIEFRQLGDLLTLKEPREAVEDLQVCVGMLSLDFGDRLEPELLHGFHARQLAVASEERQLIQNFLEESVLVADVGML